MMDVEDLRHSSQFRLLNLLSSIGSNTERKDLVIHEDLMKPIDQVAGARLLREHGIEKMFKLSSTTPPWKNPIRVYLIPAEHSVAKDVAHQLKSLKSGQSQYHVIIVPKVLNLIQFLFESLGVMDITTLHSFSWDFIPLDSSLISLEYHQLFKSCFLKGDNSLLGSVAKALMSFECLFGNFLCVATLGKKSHVVQHLIETWRNEVRPTFPSEPQFTHLIMMDRDVDLVSLLLTQLTYEGVLDENFKVQCGFVSINLEDGSNEGAQRLMINSNKDDIYSEIKGKHISAVFHHLSSKAKELQKLREKKNTSSLEEMKHFVSHDLKQIQTQQKYLALHIGACEIVMKRQSGLLEEILGLQENVMMDMNMKEVLTYLEDSMARRYDMTTIVRLMSLYSLMHDGVPEKEFKLLSKLFVQAYGYQHISTLRRLERLGLFSPRDSKLSLEPLLTDRKLPEKMSYRKVCRKLNLLPVSATVASGVNPNYVFGGVYTPMIYKLVENCLKEKEPSLDELARCYGNDLRTNSYNNPHWSKRHGGILVMVLGGVTLAEVAAINLLAQQLGRSIVVASTSTMSAASLVESVSHINDT